MLWCALKLIKLERVITDDGSAAAFTYEHRQLWQRVFYVFDWFFCYLIKPLRAVHNTDTDYLTLPFSATVIIFEAHSIDLPPLVKRVPTDIIIDGF